MKLYTLYYTNGWMERQCIVSFIFRQITQKEIQAS